jgi:hypothetical protein
MSGPSDMCEKKKSFVSSGINLFDSRDINIKFSLRLAKTSEEKATIFEFRNINNSFFWFFLFSFISVCRGPAVWIDFVLKCSKHIREKESFVYSHSWIFWTISYYSIQTFFYSCVFLYFFRQSWCILGFSLVSFEAIIIIHVSR